MNTKEKILLVQLLLEDIRSNWCWEKKNRVIKAKELCEEIVEELNDDNFAILAYQCTCYSGEDGRFFRSSFPYGYEDMSDLHGLNKTYMDKSDEFKEIVDEYLTYPEYRFEDYEELIK